VPRAPAVAGRGSTPLDLQIRMAGKPPAPIEASLDHRAVSRLQEFIRIPTTSGDGMKGSYRAAAEWIRRLSEVELSLPVEVFEPVEGKPIVVVYARVCFLLS
jgi:hypothetical protein